MVGMSSLVSLKKDGISSEGLNPLVVQLDVPQDKLLFPNAVYYKGRVRRVTIHPEQKKKK